MANGVSKIAYLDGIRGVAAFLVFLHHFLLVFYVAYYDWNVNSVHLHNWEIVYGQSLLSVFSNGNFCVDVFFILSGFVLSRKYFLLNKFELLVSGAHRRFIRIYVPVAFTLILAYLFIKANIFYNVPVSRITHSDWWFANMWTFQNPFEKLWRCLTYSTMFMGDGSLDTTMWTMSVEFYGSLFVFSFLALTHTTRHRAAMLVLALLFCFFTDAPKLSAFVLGICLNYFEQGELRSNKMVSTLLAPLLLLISLILGAYPPNDPVKGTFFSYLPPSVLIYGGWFHVVGGFMLILSFVLSANLQKCISLRVFRFLGYISFSLYLLHPLILGSFSSYVFLQLYGRYGYNHSVVYVFLFTTALCLLVSWLMARYIDDRGIKLAKYVYGKWIKKSAEVQPG